MSNHHGAADSEMVGDKNILIKNLKKPNQPVQKNHDFFSYCNYAKQSCHSSCKVIVSALINHSECNSGFLMEFAL
jgi:hypothetical protein